MATKAQVAIAIRVIDQASKSLKNISNAADKMGKTVVSNSDKLKSIGGNLTTKLTLPLVAVGAVMTKTFADFDKTLTNFEARTGSTEAQMEQVRKTAIEMGRDTAFSATAAAEAMLELAASGSSVEEAIATLPHVLNLAAAGEIELGRSSDIVTDILAQMQLGIEDAETVVNALAAGAQSSSADIQSLADGFANVGPVAKLFGMNMQDTTATLAVFAENGIKGAEAGTQLKSMLTKMSSQTKPTQAAWRRLGVSMFNTDGTVKSLNLTISELNNAMDGMTDRERIKNVQDLAGSFGQKGLAALMAAQGIGIMRDAMDDSQTAAQVAEKQMESFNGAVNQLSGSMQTFAIVVIGPFVEKVLKPIVVALTDVLNVFTSLVTEVPILGTAVVALGVGLAVIGPLLWAIGAASGVFATMGAGIAAAQTALMAFTSFIPTVIPAIVALASTLSGILSAALAGITAAIGAVTLPVIALVAALVLLAFTISELGEEALNTLKMIAALFVGLVKKIAGPTGQAFANLGKSLVMAIAKGMLDGIKWVIQAISDVGNAAIKAVKGVFGIASPSKVMMEIGANVGVGFNQGVDKNMGGVGDNLVPRMAAGVASAAPSGMGSGTTLNFYGDIYTAPGTPKQQAEQVIKEMGKLTLKRGVGTNAR